MRTTVICVTVAIGFCLWAMSAGGEGTTRPAAVAGHRRADPRRAGPARTAKGALLGE